MPVIDRDKELVEAEVNKILGHHRTWLETNFASESSWETLKRSSQVYDQILSLALPVFGVGMLDRVCLVALGSYGREEVCPQSDLDLLILFHELPLRKIENFSARLLGLLWDQKLKVGHSLRTREQCLKLAEKDYSVLTALLDARPVAGNFELSKELTSGFEKVLHSQRKAYFQAKYEDLIGRRVKFKNVIWVTEPQVMEGVGGLRDWQLVRWLSRACLDAGSPEQLQKIGLLQKSELEKIRQSLARLFKIRTALHLLTGEKTDLLESELQEKVANSLALKSELYSNPADALLEWGFSGSGLIVEVLDRLLFELNRRFKPDKPEPVPGISRLEKTQGYLLLREQEFSSKAEARPELEMSLFKAVAQSGLELAPALRTMIANRAELLKKNLEARIMELFAPDLKTSVVLKELKNLGLLENLFPELEHAFYLGQRDGYHSYTVGWHSLLCLEKIEQTQAEPEFGDDPEINWPVLKLAGLIHDLGKGSGEEHQQAGAAIGAEVAKRFKLEAEAGELLCFLIEEHLLLNHYAYRRDFYEPRAVEFLLAKIQHSSRLKMLFILTCADIQAVSDTSWTKWKDDLLRRLYHLLLARLGKKETPSKQVFDRLNQLKQMAREKGIGEYRVKDLEKLPTRYLLGTDSEKIISQLEIVDRKKPRETQIRIQKLEKPRLEVVVVCDDYPGLFSDLSGVMSALNYNILSAEINTIDETVLDIFVVEDLVAGKSEEWEQEADARNDRLAQGLTEAVAKKISVPELAARKKGIFRPRTRVEIPVEVHFDQESSDAYTIIEVQAPDQPGLLYKITRNIFEHRLDIQFAKISTRAEKVFDVFYLRNPVSKGKAGEDEIAKLVKSLLASLKSQSGPKI